jgi:tetratricopeptide (TPR) repeat protein
MKNRHRLTLFGCCILATAAGCSTHADRLRGVRAEFYSGNLDRAVAAAENGRPRHKEDADVLKLDRAMIELVSGRPREAERLLRDVRDRFDFLEQKSVAEHALAALTDDQRIAYAGEDYEKILIRAFLAIANLMAGGGDAGAYALQVADKQQQIIAAGVDESGKNSKLKYKRVAFGSYLHGVLREETQSNYDDAERSYRKVLEWEPTFHAAAGDLDRVLTGRHSEPGNGVLYVITLVGRGPYKEQVAEAPTTVSLFIADRIISHNASHTLPPTVAPVKVPRVVLSRNEISGVRVRVDGRDRGPTETIADVGRIAVQQYEEVYPTVIARAVARRVLKKGMVYATKEVVRQADNPLVNLAMDVGGVAWEAVEDADTRCWGLLPDKIQVRRVELPEGEHRVSLGADRLGLPFGPEYSKSIRISEGRNTYVLAYFPGPQMVGKILASETDAAP